MAIHPTLPPFNPFTNLSYKTSSRRHLKRERYINYSDGICVRCTEHCTLNIAEDRRCKMWANEREKRQNQQWISNRNTNTSNEPAKTQGKISKDSSKTLPRINQEWAKIRLRIAEDCLKIRHLPKINQEFTKNLQRFVQESDKNQPRISQKLHMNHQRFV